MERRDLLWLAVKSTGLFFIARAIMAVPDLIFMLRAEEFIYGKAAAALPHLSLGSGALATEIGVYALAAVVLLLVPVGRAG